MSELDDLMAACRAAPDDDAPRLVWADAVGGERGELVVIQCKLARGGLSVEETGALRARCDELLAQHGLAWSGFADVRAARRCSFRRGFVDAVEFDVTAAPWTSIFDHAPLVQVLSINGISARIDYTESGVREGDPIGWLATMFVQPQLAQLAGLAIDGASLTEYTGDTEWHIDSTSLADEALELIARSGALAGKRALAIADHFTPRGMHELIGSNALAEVERLAFQYGDLDRDQARELFAATPKLRALDLHCAGRLATIAAVIPPSIVELRVAGVRGDDLAVLAASPVAPKLERLSLQGSLASHIDKLGAFVNLRSLDLQYAVLDSGMADDDGSLQREAVPKFVALAFPALRELRPFTHLTDAHALMIADAFGRQLERFDILGYDELTCVDELRPKIAGHLLAGGYQMPAPLLRTGVDTREPWIRYGLVNLYR